MKQCNHYSVTTTSSIFSSSFFYLSPLFIFFNFSHSFLPPFPFLFPLLSISPILSSYLTSLSPSSLSTSTPSSLPILCFSFLLHSLSPSFPRSLHLLEFNLTPFPAGEAPRLSLETRYCLCVSVTGEKGEKKRDRGRKKKKERRF